MLTAVAKPGLRHANIEGTQQPGRVCQLFAKFGFEFEFFGSSKNHKRLCSCEAPKLSCKKLHLRQHVLFSASLPDDVSAIIRQHFPAACLSFMERRSSFEIGTLTERAEIIPQEPDLI